MTFVSYSYSEALSGYLTGVFQKDLKIYTTHSCLGQAKADKTSNREPPKPDNDKGEGKNPWGNKSFEGHNRV